MFCMSLAFPNIFFSLYTYSVFLKETVFYILNVLAISQLLLKYYFENEQIKNLYLVIYYNLKISLY